MNPLHDLVQDLALEIVNASAAEDDEAASEAYSALKELCYHNEGSELDHPLQWEALGDFSENADEAMQAYEKGLDRATQLELLEYAASIQFGMAESYYENENLSKARELAVQANATASDTDDEALKTAIREFLDEIGSQS